jgi:hypothetical protein
MRRTIHTLIAIPLALAGALTADSAYAHFTPAPCDFITGGGWVLSDSGAKVNFGAHGGCKNGAYWGHVNVVDHSFNPPGHLRSTRITGYLIDPQFPKARDICGEGVVDAGSDSFPVRFRVRLEDNGEPGGEDRFGLAMSNSGVIFYILSARELGPAGPTGGGGNVQLHKRNPSTTGPSPAPNEAQMCGGIGTP